MTMIKLTLSEEQTLQTRSIVIMMMSRKIKTWKIKRKFDNHKARGDFKDDTLDSNKSLGIRLLSDTDNALEYLEIKKKIHNDKAGGNFKDDTLDSNQSLGILSSTSSSTSRSVIQLASTLCGVAMTESTSLEEVLVSIESGEVAQSALKTTHGDSASISDLTDGICRDRMIAKALILKEMQCSQKKEKKHRKKSKPRKRKKRKKSGVVATEIPMRNALKTVTIALSM
eukprot:scaffold85964_cov97-Cyclotella_meneghiniana.AAC.1